MGYGVGYEVVPPAFAADLPVVHNVIRLLRGKYRSGDEAAKQGPCDPWPNEEVCDALHGHDWLQMDWA
jgi:hypothetical protein